MTDDSYRLRHFGPLKHRWWDTQPRQKYGTVEETWRLGPFELVRHHMRDDKSYGDWSFSMMLAWRRWHGPWFTVGFGNGAQDWDRDEI